MQHVAPLGFVVGNAPHFIDLTSYLQSQWRDLNPRPLPYQGSTLPLSYIGL